MSTTGPLASRVMADFNLNQSPYPIFVDLDGTLIQTDLLFESLLSGVKRDPTLLLKLPIWLLKGRAYVKRRIAERHDVEVSTLPYREPLREFLRAEAANGRSIYLATASDRLLAEAVAKHLGFFRGVLASDGTNNLKGKRKLAAIQVMTDGVPFEYAGNGSEDLEIWAAAHGAIVVAAPPSVAAAAEKLGNVRRHFRCEPREIRVLVGALRPQQWLKNLLVFVALMTSLSFGHATAWLHSSLAFAAFCLVASGIYIVNDLLDLGADRAHPRKRQRPFAAGRLSPQTGMLMSIVLVVTGCGLGALLPWPTLPLLAGYLVLTLLYSLILKAYVLMDVAVLAGLMSAYLATALAMCKLTRTEPSILLHPLDLLGGDQVPELRFFPGMDLPAERKPRLFVTIMEQLAPGFELVPMGEHARRMAQRPLPIRVPG